MSHVITLLQCQNNKKTCTLSQRRNPAGGVRAICKAHVCGEPCQGSKRHILDLKQQARALPQLERGSTRGSHSRLLQNNVMNSGRLSHVTDVT